MASMIVYYGKSMENILIVVVKSSVVNCNNTKLLCRWGWPPSLNLAILTRQWVVLRNLSGFIVLVLIASIPANILPLNTVLMH